MTVKPGSKESATATEFARGIRINVLRQSKRANVGHIGSALSIADMLAALYANVMSIKSVDDPDRDRFILSKGHAALALFAALRMKGWLSEEELNTYCADNSLLGAHPEAALSGIDFSSGSLGMGLSVGAGAAIAARLKSAARRVFVLLSDAELNEGALWEAVMFAGHHKLSRLTAIIDLNGQQALGYTKDVLDLSPIDEKWRMFGWDTHVVDGHDIEEMTATLRALDYSSGPPHVLVARTTFGKGVSYMENQIKWHYCPMSDDDFAQAMREVEG